MTNKAKKATAVATAVALIPMLFGIIFGDIHCTLNEHGLVVTITIINPNHATTPTSTPTSTPAQDSPLHTPHW